MMKVSSKQVLKTPFLPVDREFKWISDNPKAARQKYSKQQQHVRGSKVIDNVEFRQEKVG